MTFSYTKWTGKIVPDRDFEDLFVVVAMYTELLELGIGIHEIGAVSAGEKKSFSMKVRNVLGSRPKADAIDNRLAFYSEGLDEFEGVEAKYFTMFFENGLQVRSNDMQRGDKVLNLLKLKQHANILERHIEKHQGESVPPKPIMRTPPDFTGIQMPEGALMVNADIYLDERGIVEKIALTGDIGALPPTAADAIAEALRSWVFLPKLDKGNPEPTKIRLPFKF